MLEDAEYVLLPKNWGFEEEGIFRNYYVDTDIRDKATKNFSIVSPIIDETVTKLNDKNFQSLNKIQGYAEFTDEYVKRIFKTDNQTDSIIQIAKEVFEEIEEHKNFVDVISGNVITNFPVGIKKHITQNTQLSIGIINARFHSLFAEVDMFAKLELGEIGTELFFGASNVKISHEGGIYDQASLNLLSDIPVSSSGGQWLLTFKGGIKRNGKPDDESFITIDCDGNIIELALNADIRISKNIAVPLKRNGDYKFPNDLAAGDGNHPVDNDSYVGAEFYIRTTSLENLLIEINLPHFEIKGLKGWGFEVKDCVLDLSDTLNSSAMSFPKYYVENNLLIRGQRELWRGFFSREVNIMLPKEFKSRNSKERIIIGAENLIIDNYGISGEFFAEHVLSINKGIASKWAFSVDAIKLNIASNHFIEAGFNGEINLPVANPETKGGLLSYEAIVTEQGEYILNTEIEKDVAFDIFNAKAKIFPESYIQLKLKDGNFYPEANLTGVMSFNKEQDSALNSFEGKQLAKENFNELDFEGLAFQNFKIQTIEKPYLQVAYIGFKDTVDLMKFSGFNIGVYKTSLLVDNDQTANLKFNCFIQLDDQGLKGDLGIHCKAAYQSGDILNWKISKIHVDSIQISAERKGFKLNGKLNFLSESTSYGDAIGGNLDLYIPALNISLNAGAIFGKKDAYKYWYVDAYGDPSSGNNLNFKIFKIGGGLYHHMRKGNYDKSSESLSGIKYIPDESINLGFKALAAFEVRKQTTFTGLTGIEISFNKSKNGGGINRVGFYGAGSIMSSNSSDDSIIGNLGNFETVQKDLADREKALLAIDENTLDHKGMKFYAEEVFPDVLSGKEMFAAQVAFDYDFENEIYWGLFDVYLNLGGIRGDGVDNRLGYLEFYNSPKDWYIYIGTPDKRIGVKDIPIGLYRANANLYFMTGTILPKPSAPPNIISELLNLKGDERIFNRNYNNDLAIGKGYAFGAQFSIGLGFDWGLIYASVEAGVGLDLMMRDFGEATCRGSSEEVGLNGWYASGQVYAYLQGELGVAIRIFGLKTKVPILKSGIALLAQGHLPNPWFIKGYAGVNIKVLGTIAIKARLKITIGEECEIIERTGLDQVEVISDILPYDNSTNTDVFESIQIAFNFPIGEILRIDETQESKNYRIKLNRFEVKDGNRKIKGDTLWNDLRDHLIFEPNDILPEETQLIIIAQVGFEERIDGTWVQVKQNGVPVIEERRSTFTTGLAPSILPFKNIELMYPVIAQKYLLPKTYKYGFIQLKKGQDYLFDSEFKDKLLLINESLGDTIEQELSYDKTNNRIKFDLRRLVPNSAYRVNIISIKTASDIKEKGTNKSLKNLSQEISISENKLTGSINRAGIIDRFEFAFTTSKYKTFKEKIRNLKVKRTYTFFEGTEEAGLLGFTTTNSEPFSIVELKGSPYGGYKPLISVKAILKSRYYLNEIYPLLYKEYPLNGNLKVTRNILNQGLPPNKNIIVDNRYLSAIEYNDLDFLSTNFPFQWKQSIIFWSDFKDLQNQIVRKYLNTETINLQACKHYNYIINGAFPFINREEYQVMFEYVVPDQDSGEKVDIEYLNEF
ncbi:hypothetical protein DMZ48_12270 [Robertkochia solimangrovi]|nr:hypothetical protein DMZ48_12270 [Robertkochia solimangrovi]